MRSVQPEVFLVARPAIDYDQLAAYLQEVGGEKWLERLDRGELASDAENLAEFAGKMCYRAWEPGLNPNVRKVRNDHEAYLQNILKQAHGSVLEHASFTFVLHNVSRVFCYDDETEVLTTEGWKPWPKVDGTEVFGTLNPVSNELEYQRATEVFHADYAGPMYRVRSSRSTCWSRPITGCGSVGSTRNGRGEGKKLRGGDGRGNPAQEGPLPKICEVVGMLGCPRHDPTDTSDLPACRSDQANNSAAPWRFISDRVLCDIPGILPR